MENWSMRWFYDLFHIFTGGNDIVPGGKMVSWWSVYSFECGRMSVRCSTGKASAPMDVCGVSKREIAMAEQTKHEIFLDGERVSYIFTRKHVKNINMRIRPETGLMVSAPFSVSMTQVEEVLYQNRTKILKALHQYAGREARKAKQYPTQYMDGETILYLGKVYTLKVAYSRTEGVQLERDCLLLLTKNPKDAAHRKRILDTWWDTTCGRAVRNLCRAVYPIFQKYQVPFPTIRFRAMVSQWGNCRPERGVLTFNTRLLAAPVRCMEYVVIHEFTHFLYPNHSAQFYQFIAGELPDWRKLQEILQNEVETRISR